MKQLVFTLAALSLLVLPASSRAQETAMGGLGFHAGSSPFDGLGFLTNHDFAVPTLALRHWFGERVGADIGVGYFSVSTEPSENKVTGVMFTAGLPISVKRVSDKVNFILRPGILWGTQEEEVGPPPVVTTKWTAFAVTGELEVEWMVTERLSLSGSHGFAYGQLRDDGTPETKITSVGTLGNNFTSLGFTCYLW